MSDRKEQISKKINQLQERLAPQLETSEDFRKKFVKRTWLYSIPAFLVFPIDFFFNSSDVSGPVFAGVLMYFSVRQRIYAQSVKVEIVKPLSKFFGLEYKPEGSSEILHQAKDAKILPSYNRGGAEDAFVGEVKGTTYEFTEAHLKYESGSGKNSSTRPVFDGCIMRFKLPYSVSEDLLILSDAGLFNKLKDKTKAFSGMQHIALEDPVFEKMYQAYGRDQIEARRVLTPLFMQVLADLKERFDAKSAEKRPKGFFKKIFHGISPNIDFINRGKNNSGTANAKVQMLFSGDRLLLSIDYKNDLFEPKSSFKKLDQAWMKNIIEEFALMRFIASSLKLQKHNYAHTQVEEELEEFVEQES